MSQPKPVAKVSSSASLRNAIYLLCAFLFGCVVTLSIVLHINVASPSAHVASNPVVMGNPQLLSRSSYLSSRIENTQLNPSGGQYRQAVTSGVSALQGLSVLVAIASFDFSQLPHLEEVLDSYHDLAVAGATVDVVIHTTIAYPVTLIDLWNTRLVHPNFSLTVAIKPKSLRLHLVDCHRSLFYERLDQYDLFIYTEDDIRVTPSTVAAYLAETARVHQLIQGSKHHPSDFNVGIVRYEYNYPTNVIIDDNTRHATMNVSRTYWEHSGFKRPVVPNAIEHLRQEPLTSEYVTMQNHHQGMFLATQDLLRAWKDRSPSCDFSKARDRPGRGSQPTEGTQRVWMSSQMLYGRRHCRVQQLLPKLRFPTLTVLHLPNKNYRRVGKYRKRKFADGTEVFDQPHESLLTAMEVHIALRQAFPPSPQQPYRGIRMVDEVTMARDRTPLLERRLKEFKEYVHRGGVLTDSDMTKTTLVEAE